MSGKKVYNFAAGPSKVPEEVLAIAQRELINYDNTGLSVMELSHRSSTFDKIINGAIQDLRDLLSIPSNYKVLFVQGGGTQQFAAVPLNLCTTLGEEVDYIITGTWSKKAAEEAEKYCKVNKIMNDSKSFTSIPDYKSKLNPNAKYVYYCANETIQGVEFQELVESNGKLLVCDMSSNFCTRKIDVSKYAVIYAGAQKNAGIAGLTIIIVREDVLNQANPLIPITMHYKTMADNNSLYNTPPCYAIYISGLCFKHFKNSGALVQLEKVSIEKSKLVYDMIDNSNGFYSSKIDKNCRSRVNIPFRIAGGDDALEKKFLDESAKRGMLQLKGHRSVGGIRVSLFNAIRLDEAKDFVSFMLEFQKNNQP